MPCGEGANNFDRRQGRHHHECHGAPEGADGTSHSKGVDGAPADRGAATVAIDGPEERNPADGVWCHDDRVPSIEPAAVPHLHLLPALEGARLQEFHVMPGAATGECCNAEREDHESGAGAWYHGQGLSDIRAV